MIRVAVRSLWTRNEEEQKYPQKKITFGTGLGQSVLSCSRGSAVREPVKIRRRDWWWLVRPGRMRGCDPLSDGKFDEHQLKVGTGGPGVAPKTGKRAEEDLDNLRRPCPACPPDVTLPEADWTRNAASW